MQKRYILGGAVILAAIVAVILFLAPTAVDPDAHRLPDDTTGPGQEGMTATGTPSTAAADPQASPAPGEVTVTP